MTDDVAELDPSRWTCGIFPDGRRVYLRDGRPVFEVSPLEVVEDRTEGGVKIKTTQTVKLLE